MTPHFIVMLIAAVAGCGPVCSLTEKLRLILEKEENLAPKENLVQVILYTAAFLLVMGKIIYLPFCHPVIPEIVVQRGSIIQTVRGIV